MVFEACGRSPRGHENGSMKNLWPLEPERVFLNHGSYGACPIEVLAKQNSFRAEMERSPVYYFLEVYPKQLSKARESLAAFLGSKPEHLALTTNATSAVNAVLQSRNWNSGDRIITSDHLYRACHNTLLRLAERHSLEIDVVKVDYPNVDYQKFLFELEKALSPRTKIGLFDHVASRTALVFPIEQIAKILGARDIPFLVDGAHAAGMLDLNLEKLGSSGVTYYTGNFHKWCCSPKGAAFLWTAEKNQGDLYPTVTSHGYSPTDSRSRFLEEFDWCGTFDPSAWLCVPESIDFLTNLYQGGLPQMRVECRNLLRRGREIVAGVLPAQTLPSMDNLAQMASVELPGNIDRELYLSLYNDYAIDCQLTNWNNRNYVRISAAPYNLIEDYTKLAEALTEIGQKFGWEQRP